MSGPRSCLTLSFAKSNKGYKNSLSAAGPTSAWSLAGARSLEASDLPTRIRRVLVFGFVQKLTTTFAPVSHRSLRCAVPGTAKIFDFRDPFDHSQRTLTAMEELGCGALSPASLL